MTKRRLWFIADDYALSPGVSESIRALISAGRLSGTGCMTLFPEWPEEAAKLRNLPPRAAIGLHLTLTDQEALSGNTALAPEGRLPSLPKLLRLTSISRQAADAAMHELDQQYERFVKAMGRAPDFLDGHQHVHFLPVARRWLTELRQKHPETTSIFVRGAPAFQFAPRNVLAKVAVVKAVATGYDAFVRGMGLAIAGPLAGFYEWNNREAFAAAVAASIQRLPENAIFMCHPGQPDEILAARDPLTAPRAVEHDFLASDVFPTLLQAADVEIAGIVR